jgi:RNA polymerase nonessential primary-like sigma factor
MPEKDLFDLARVNKKARDVLVRKYLYLVRIIARSYWGLPREDLFQEGCVGLLFAIDRFEPDLGYHFSTYSSWWIRKLMSRAIQRDSRPIYVPARVHLD